VGTAAYHIQSLRSRLVAHGHFAPGALH
jgi:hypothetical protein